ncbi:hypothetical protein BA768_00505 [Chryseobacterium sp. CBo1]|uniref:DoxX family protein n=1 Tax=Chryseobacterium sp. CBo1 TaxID=1869230 RepID=UPI0008103A39|nr:hypothetical protein [Chryseobacterium sp. CBo1]OCK53071.1 hypothetical protein BA768_00505 [Chryseobacterium sp. CBo1]
MEPEITLVGFFLLSAIIFKLAQKQFQFARSGRIGMASMLILTGVGHFVFAKGMKLMLPEIIPYRLELIYITGVIEIIMAVTLLMPKYRVTTARWLIIFFIILLPANIYGAIYQVNLETGSYDGAGINYLWYRIPLQVFFILWVYFSAIKISKPIAK